jgi:hypothetical protein
MNDVEGVWWCRTPKKSVVYGSGERHIRGERRIALHEVKMLKRLYQPRNFTMLLQMQQ